MDSLKSIIVLLLAFSFPLFSNAQEKVKDPETRIKELGIVLKAPAPPIANFIDVVRVGNLLYLADQGPLKPDGTWVMGKVGKELNLQQAQAAARLTGICLLEVLKTETGNLNNIKRIVKVLGVVNAVPEFTEHSKVMNGFSDLMVEVFGENGRHARSAIGAGSLPFNTPVEIEMIVELK